MTSITATAARKNLYSLLDDVAESHEPVQIAGKRHSAVLIADEDWRSVQETLHLAGIRKGLRTPVEKCAKELDW